MAKTCLVCGEKAGSAEHIFPAALGGRRTNRGIYCTAHNNGYSPLAALLTEQLEYFNAALGVIHDRTRKVRPARMTELASGRTLKLADGDVSFDGPETIEPGEHALAFSSLADAEAWAERQRAKGMKVEFGKPSAPTAYFPGTSRVQIKLGGPESFRAIGYVGQTFLAHAFPDLARVEALKPFITSSYFGESVLPVWWEFDAPSYSQPSPFEFGHRIVVGVDADAKVVYGRISLFSAFDYGMVFGPTDLVESTAKVFDIDPLATAAPVDLVETVVVAPPPAPQLSTSPNDDLRRELIEGRAANRVSTLLNKIEARERAQAVGRLFGRIQTFLNLPLSARSAAFTDLIEEERQRVFSLLQASLREFESSDAGTKVKTLGLVPSELARSDSSSPDGLSDSARETLDRACAAMAHRLHTEFEEGALNEERVYTLIVEGEGRAVVLSAALAPFFPAGSLDAGCAAPGSTAQKGD
ncbi:hypothetical protein [Aureimonas sp. SK2]|uniref:hypothetical protein n=1 Tax=Aureimonas sp. SK2 TaxID=3015992 RepID=UPI002443EC1D|nr:hypothetical protein [Aureimonas sp. SK2]